MSDRRRRTSVLAPVMGLCILLAASLAGPATGVAAAESSADRLSHLAEQGRFLDLLELLRDEQEEPARPLLAALERYETNESRRQAERLELYEEAMAELAEHLEGERLEQALVAAIDAHRQARDKRDVLRHEQVRQLVEQVEAAAADAEDDADWIGALTYYQLLDLLHENQDRYSDAVDQARRHVRLLQVYAPDHFAELQEARRAARAAAREEAEDADDRDAADELDEPIAEMEHEPWQERLEGVQLRMFRQALRQTARQHISGSGFVPLLGGAVEQLHIVLNTQALAEVFPGLGDEAQVKAFREELDRITASLNEPGKELSALEANQMLDRIGVANNRTVKLPEAVLAYELTEGATQTLDEFSSVIWPREQERFTRSLEGRFFGIGIHISRRNGQLVVISPLPNTPAQRAGVKAGDVIAQVDGQESSTWSLDRAVREITGPEGSEVRLGLRREGEAELIETKIQRAEIPIESIRGWSYDDDHAWDWMIDPEQRIGYVRLTQFIPQSARDLDAAIDAMRADGGLNGLILDLRSNPGGLLSAAIEVADRFIEEGPIVFTVDAAGRRTFEGAARRDRTYDDRMPLVVLVNEGSASASEIVAGALQDHGLATIVGSRSFGKGSVQDPFRLDRGNAILKLTTQYYMLPDERIIDRRPDADRWGIEPDLLIDMTRSQHNKAQETRLEADTLRDPGERDEYARATDLIEQGLDPQLEAALLLMQARVVAGQLKIAKANAE